MDTNRKFDKMIFTSFDKGGGDDNELTLDFFFFFFFFFERKKRIIFLVWRGNRGRGGRRE